jgi:recombination protein RecA
VSAPILSLKLPLPQGIPLAEQLPAGRLIEIVRHPAGAQMTTAVACLHRAQSEGEPGAWVQPEGGSLYPPDLAESGVDLEALLVVHVPRRAGVHGLAKAAELLLRSGGFGMVVVDLSELPAGAERFGDAWQGRLLGLAREHRSWLLLLSDGQRPGSLGPLVSVCVEPRRRRTERGRFVIEQHLRKDKSGSLYAPSEEQRRGPWGSP